MRTPPMMTRARVLQVGLGAAGAAALPRGLRAETAIRAGNSTNATTLEAAYADGLGIFKKMNLDVTVAPPFGGGGPVMAGVISRDLDVGTTTPIQLAIAIAKGLPLQMIAGGAVWNAGDPIVALAVAKNSPIRDAKELIGQTVACSNLVDVSIVGVDAWLDRSGVPIDSIKALEMPFNAMAAALNRGLIGAAVLAEPALSAARDQVRLLPAAFESLGARWLVTCWFGHRDFIRANPELIKRFVSAIYEAGRTANEHPERTLAILAKESTLPLDTIRTMPRIEFAGHEDASIVDPELALAYRFKVVARPLTYAALMSGGA